MSKDGKPGPKPIYGERMIAKSFQLSEDQADWIEVQSKKRGVSQNVIVRLVLQSVIDSRLLEKE